jgi:hypothetical protein
MAIIKYIPGESIKGRFKSSNLSEDNKIIKPKIILGNSETEKLTSVKNLLIKETPGGKLISPITLKKESIKNSKKKILIHLPAYREPELIPTIKSALENA